MSNMMFQKLKKIYNLDDDKIINNTINKNNEILTKQKKCKLCNKKYNDKNRYYGSSCLKKIYNNSDVAYIKEVDDKEVYLHSAVILELGKANISNKEMNYVCQSYFSKLILDKNSYLKQSELSNIIDKCIDENKKPIMKLNTAYRINNITKRNKNKLDTIDSEDLDKIIDEKIIKFLKIYFSLSKITSPLYYEICYYMQYIIWEIVIRGGKIFNYKFASNCLSHSLSAIGEKPKNVRYTDCNKYLINLIKQDIGFKNKVKRIIKKYGKNDNIKFHIDDNNKPTDALYSFESGDLLYSLHSVTIELDGIKKNDKWDLNIKLSDNYDFTEILSNDKYTKKDKKYFSLANQLNDMGTVSTCYGVLKSYDITITFNWGDFGE